MVGNDAGTDRRDAPGGEGELNPTRPLELLDDAADERLAAFARDVAAGLLASPKRLPCCYFYDREGSRLFEEICGLPEYYLTRAEREILTARSASLAAAFQGPLTVVELGSGSAAKTRILIEAFLRRGALRYVPVDISRPALEESARALLRDYPDLEVTALAGTYEEGLRRLSLSRDRRTLVLWLGSSIGNLERPAAARFLRIVRDAIAPEGRLLVGIDLRKDRETLERAYDDAQGVTARFNRNLLARINRELGGSFDLETFGHRAVYDEEEGRIEMSLVSTPAQQVRIGAMELTVRFEAGEAVHTENSYKYSLFEVEALAARAGLLVERTWLDGESRFSLNLLAPSL